MIESCPRCKARVECILMLNGPHLGLYCAKYRHWIRWIKKKEAEKL